MIKENERGKEMTEKKLIHDVIEKEMPDIEAVRRNCLALGKATDAARKKKLPAKKWAAVAVCIVAVLCAGNGINYASTGVSPLELFQGIFKDSDPVTGTQITENMNMKEQVITSREWNLKYTLQSYWYDQETGTLLTQTEVSTLDGSPLVSWEDIFANGDGVNQDISQWYKDAAELQREFEAGEEDAVGIYENAVDTYMEENSLFMDEGYTIAVGSQERSVEGAAVRYYSIWYNIHDKNGKIADKIVLRPLFACDDANAKFVITDTGSMRERKIDIEEIPYCTNVRLTGAYMAFTLEPEDSGTMINGVGQLEITMKDGTILRGNGNFRRPDETDQNKDTAKESAAEQNICNMEMSMMVDDNTGTRYILAAFHQFIDVDDIVSVTIEGRECLPD